MTIIFDGQADRYYSPPKFGTGFRKKGLSYSSLYQGGAWRDFGSNVVIGNGKPEFTAQKKEAKQQEALDKIISKQYKGDGFAANLGKLALGALEPLKNTYMKEVREKLDNMSPDEIQSIIQQHKGNGLPFNATPRTKEDIISGGAFKVC